MRTYQDLLAVGENEKDRMEFVRGAVQDHTSSDDYKIANKKQEELRQTVERQQCYISGLEYALRHMTPTVVVESHEKETKEKAG